MPEFRPGWHDRLLILAGPCRLGGRGCFCRIAEHCFQGADFDNGALAASGNDGNGTEGHVGSCERFGVNTMSMHSIRVNIAAMLWTSLLAVERPDHCHCQTVAGPLWPCNASGRHVTGGGSHA